MIAISTANLAERRERLVEQLARQGIRDEKVLAAMRNVPREAFLPAELEEFAYQNTALPIAKDQTISQPLIVAMMTEALELHPDDRVLEIGTGSGYAAAVLGEVAGEVYTVERHEELAEEAARRLQEQGFDNVHVRHANGTLGWPEHAPYEAIVVTAGGPDVPRALLAQLKVGGRLVIPVGEDQSAQKLVRVRKTGADAYEQDDLGDVRFVPLIGAEGWDGEESRTKRPPRRNVTRGGTVATLIREEAEPIGEVEEAALDALLDRIGDARLVLIGEATHGTSEFYRMRARITQELIRRRHFDFVALEADWPDAARINYFVQHSEVPLTAAWEAFARFPLWMWRNYEVLQFIDWLRDYNREHHAPDEGVGIYGLDLYSLYTSIRSVLEYLERVDPAAARTARERYGCLSPWEGDPATYGRAAISGRYRSCEQEAVAMLRDLLTRRMEYAQRDGRQYFDAAQNAKLVADAERYYRTMYYGGSESWNLRDQHMFDTLQALLEFHGPETKAVVWEHNSHLGDAAATQMGAEGEINVGHLCRREYREQAYLIGQGTDHGTVAAAPFWDADVEIMDVRSAIEGSYERLCHDSGGRAFFLHLRHPRRSAVREELEPSRLERAIGVVYRPQTERQSHYFQASLPHQFDEFIWFDRTRAVRPIHAHEARRHKPPHPFAVID